MLPESTDSIRLVFDGMRKRETGIIVEGCGGNLSEERFSPMPPSKDFAGSESIFDCLSTNVADDSDMGNRAKSEETSDSHQFSESGCR